MIGSKILGDGKFVEVPPDLTYFSHGDSYLVINPQIGGRSLLDSREFAVLSRLASGLTDGLIEAFPDFDRILAKLILRWIVYFNGNSPKLEVSVPRLRQVYYAITDGCNLRCPYCYASSEKRLPGELSTQQSLEVVSQIAAIGADVIIFTGGEPMLRRDLFEVVQHARNKGLRANIVTNATLIKNPETAQKFSELFDMVTISVDGATAASHDTTRGRGTFESTCRAIKLLNDAGVEPNINHIVSSDNVNLLEEFANFVSKLKIGSIRLMSHNKLGRGNGDGHSFEWRDHLAVQQAIWTSPLASKLRPDGPKALNPCSVRGNCGMGSSEIYINSLGNVYPCKLITEKQHCAGNIKYQSLEEMYSGVLFGGMQASTVFKGKYHSDCSKCYIKTACGGGCRATHMSETSDLAKNSRNQCRILRHGIVTQLWIEAGVNRRDLSQHHDEMTIPRLLADKLVHPVYLDWQDRTRTQATNPKD